ncbi:MCE family protein [Planotetraspora sp. A-T 1434]|uniref:MlaD family protein n=1 Tax=Planotetraspora sp. A-T 1434 TaxID=2979219 RepID=UPI0021BE89C1|nr:MCE family protein [Planotetraspora sp. A-T 1434]MCT9930491.1 MCE family protein [Planotetraspora sp. A-T 1434]
MALKSFRDRDRVAVGLVSLGVFAAILAGTFLVGTLGVFEGGYRMSGVFADSGGLKAGNDVRVAGVVVGRVTEVRPDYSRGVVVVTWKVDDGVHLGRRTRAEITLSNLLGGRYVRLSGPAAPPYLDRLPESGRVVPLERTGTPVLVTDALKDATGVVRRLDTKAVDRLLDELARIGPGRKGRMTRLLADIGELSGVISRSRPELRRLIGNGTKIMDLVRRKDKELGRLVDSIQIMLAELRRRRGELRTLLGGGSDLVARMSALIDRHEKSLLAVIDDVSAIGGTLEQGDEDLNATLAWVGPAFSGLSGIGGHGPWIEAVTTGLGPIDPGVLGGLRDGR